MTRIILIGAGRGGRALVELLHRDPSVEIVGVADKDEGAPGIVLARELGLPVAANYRKFLKADTADLIIDVTGDPDVSREVYRLRPQGTEVVGGKTARFISEFAGNRNPAEAFQDQYQLALRELEARAEGEFIIGNNLKMKEISGLISKVAPTPTTVLIRGESGTGKELVARAIHRNSTRSNHPLVTLNCTALSPALLESELFGYKRGAFTGAYNDRKGLFEKADGGTMFLDEIGDMSLEIQAKFLRTLQTGRDSRRRRHADTQKVSVQNCGRHQPGPGDRDSRRHVPRRPVLSDQYLHDYSAPTARADRRYPISCGVLFAAGPGQGEQESGEHRSASAGAAEELFLAGQSSRTGKHH